MNIPCLKSNFTNEFLNEFKFDAEFTAVCHAIEKGMNTYQVIEHLFRSKKELLKQLNKAIENAPTRIIVTTEEFEKLQENTLKQK